MNFKKSVLRSAVISAMGVAGVAALMPSTANAVAIADGSYQAVINVTPGGATPSFGTDGAWSSSFSFGLNSPNSGSQKMTNNSTTISTPNGTRGSASSVLPGAGTFNISLAGGAFTASNFQMDAILATAGGTFVQYGSITGGTVTGSGGMSLDVTGRLAGVSGSFPSPGSLHDERWNVDDFTVGGATAWRAFTTGASGNLDTASNSTSPGAHTSGLGFLNAGAITGAEAVAIADVNSDGLTDYRIILVSAGHVGSDWGGFFGAGYLEAWNINLLSQEQVSAVPIPAAAWLFGSGLLGLATIAR